MARFHGNIGYGDPVEDPVGSGVWKFSITEYPATGNVIKNSALLRDGENSVNGDIAASNSISILADEYAMAHFHKIKYVTWLGANWSVTRVEVKRPRLVLTLGGVYNGPTE